MSDISYEGGRRRFNELRGNCLGMTQEQSRGFDVVGNIPNNERVTQFDKGYHDAMKDYLQEVVGISAFIEELEVLCKKHNAFISSGCGCCIEAGGWIQDPESPSKKWGFYFSVGDTVP